MIPGSSSRVPSKLEEGSTCSPGHTHHIYHALAGASTTPGYALRMGEERKMIAHAGVCRAAGVIFIPLVVESLGGWTEEVIQTIKSIGRLQPTSWDSPTRHNAPSVPATSYLPLERECLAVGQAAASLLSHSRWHCLTLSLFLIVYF